MTKKSLATITFLTLALTACGQGQEDNRTAMGTSSSASSATAVASVTDPSAAATLSRTEEAVASSAPAEAVAQEATEEPAAEAPAETPSENPSPAGEGENGEDKGGAPAESRESLSPVEQTLDQGYHLEDLAQDIEITADPARTVRPEKVGIYTLESTNTANGGEPVTRYTGTQAGLTSSFDLVYLPGAEYVPLSGGFADGTQVGNGSCGFRLDGETTAVAQCEFPVAEGGLIRTNTTIAAPDLDILEIHLDFYFQASASLVDQMVG